MKLIIPPKKIRKIYLSGASTGLVEAARISKKRNLPVVLLTAPRYLSYEIPGGILLTEYLKALGVEIHVFGSLTELDRQSAKWNLSECLLLSYGAPFIFREEFLRRFGGLAFNVHPSPLPKFRGGGGYSWRILSGESKGCISIHQLTSGIDDGLLAMTLKFKFPKTIRIPKHFEEIEAEKSIDITRRFLNLFLMRKSIILKPQLGVASYFPRLNTNINGAIDWSWDAKNVERFIRAFSHPYPGAFTQAHTKSGQMPVRIFDAKARDGSIHPFMAGLIIDYHHKILTVACGKGTVRIESSNLVCARSLVVGDRLLTDSADLVRAKTIRVSYGPHGLKLTPPIDR